MFPCPTTIQRLGALLLLVGLAVSMPAQTRLPALHWADASRNGRSFSKDPSLLKIGGRYLLYYSTPPATNRALPPGWAIGIAESRDLLHWQKVGELLPAQDCDRKGLCAPAAIALAGKVHLFYQTYGNGTNDAICHATSNDGLHFTRDSSNPVFRPSGNWTAVRAIDAEVFPAGDQLILLFATRDPTMKVQMLGVAGAPLDSDYARSNWKQLCDAPVLKPELPWEKQCIEAPSVIRRGGTFFMFYAGGYNNEPQQIGVATSRDGLSWQRLSTKPYLPNGAPGEWNASESGHPGIFSDGDETYLFFQGNSDQGRTWFLSAVELGWNDTGPFVRHDSAKFPSPTAR